MVPLAVSAPFHSPMMAPVQPRLREVLQSIPLSKPTPAVVTNVEARPNDEEARVVDLLVEQVVKPVLWEQSIQWMVAAGVDRMIEVGPGKVLAGLIRRIDKSVQVTSVGDMASLRDISGFLGC